MHASSVTHDSANRATTVRVQAIVRGGVQQVARASDPQSWSQSSPFFAETYKVDKSTYCRTEPVPIGTSWGGHLFESFASPLVSFENVLAVRFETTVHEVHLAYGLYDSLSWTFLGVKGHGPLEVDRGFLHAREVAKDAPVSEVTIEKTLVFAEDGVRVRWFARWAPLMLAAWVEASSRTVHLGTQR
jgi:hypothetical protein